MTFPYALALISKSTLQTSLRAIWFYLFALALILMPTLPMCVAVLTIAFYRRRKHPSFINIFSFKQPFWLALFASLGVAIFGLVGGLLIPHLFPLDPKGLVCIQFVLIMLAGGFGCIASSIWCLWQLIAAIHSYIHAKQQEQPR